SYSHNIAIGPSYDSRLSEDAYVVLFDLKQIERKLALRYLLEEGRLRARGAVRFYMGALLIDNLIHRVDVGGEQGINATLLHCCHGVFCRLRHGAPLCAAIDRLLAGTGLSTYFCQTETLSRIVLDHCHCARLAHRYGQ